MLDGYVDKTGFESTLEVSWILSVFAPGQEKLFYLLKQSTKLVSSSSLSPIPMPTFLIASSISESCCDMLNLCPS